jgi:hypothetical protein
MSEAQHVPFQGEPPASEALTLGNAILSVAGAGAAIMIRLTGAGQQHHMKFVLADIAGTLGLFYLALLGLAGWGFNMPLAIGLAGFAAAAGWASVFAVLQRLARSRNP